MSFRNEIAILIPFAILAGACNKPEKAVEEFKTAEDVPTPSDDIDDIPLEELEELDEQREQDNDDDSDIDDDDDDDDNNDDDGDNDDDDNEPTIEYSFDSDSSLIYVQVFKDDSTIGSGFAHDHVMRADNYSGYVLYNIDDLSECYISFSLPVDDLRVDEAGMRDYVGYGDSLNDSDRAQIREHMLDSGQLNADSYSNIRFESSSCTGDGGLIGTLDVAGVLTVRGNGANVTPEVDVTVYDGKFYAQAKFNVNHASFGMTPYSAYGGAVRNDDPLKFTIDLVGIAR